MDIFRQKYSIYYNVLYITGLWPYNQSIPSKILRMVFPLLTLCCIAIQVILEIKILEITCSLKIMDLSCEKKNSKVSTLRLIEMSLYNILMLLSYCFPMLLFFLRYVGFVVNFPVIRCLYENIVKDYTTLSNPVESEMLTKQIVETGRVVLLLLGWFLPNMLFRRRIVCAVYDLFKRRLFGFTALSLGVVLFVVATLLVPTLLHSKYQTHYLRIFGFFYSETGLQTDLVCYQLVLVSTIGVIALAGTEATLAVFSFYLCGLFEITRYVSNNCFRNKT
ncbi:uncharacterized protein LOC143212915 [Lasioglossum baleicum]|uniref:uncharacterized protein LOC143212915 n=1 Tax=Lasioglossum baleicum TaxID=434251 RepID=UPI003FCCAF63